MDVAGRRITVMGLGRHGGGVAAARFLAQHGAAVTVTDLATADELAESLAALADVPIAGYCLGRHDEEDFRGADSVVVNPAVRPAEPLLQVARANGARLTSEIELFLERCPAPIIGITGSNGKSTTASMLGAIGAAAGQRVWLGGNIGASLLDDLGRMVSGDFVILELSSFQLAHLSLAAKFPEIAVVTNCTPNHLDWHGVLQHYMASKQRLVREQPGHGKVVLNPWDAEVASWNTAATGSVLSVRPFDQLPTLKVPGLHNRINACLAATAAAAAGCDEAAIQRALAEFSGLPHRLQKVGKVAGRRFYNDSKGTTPAATCAALAAVDGPIWLLAGGYDKGVDFDDLGRAIAQRVHGAAVFGAAGTKLRAAIERSGGRCELSESESLASALAWCWERSQWGDAIVLSPACSSHDQFRDFVERGNRFVDLVRRLESETDLARAAG